MNSFWSDPNVQAVVAGVMLLGASAGLTGAFTLVRKRALLGDAIAHAVLPGVCLAFLITGQKNPVWLLLGALVTGWLSLLSMDFIARHSKLKPDTAIAAVLSTFFGLGIVLLTYIQHSGGGNQAGLDKFLFGKAASLTLLDVQVFGLVAVGIAGVTLVFFRAFRTLAFDRDFAAAAGMPVRLLEFVLATITVLVVATGIQAVGVVLMAALLITPAAAARFWTDSLWKIAGLAALLGSTAGLFGVWISTLAPAMPTGPWVVVWLSVVAAVSAVAAPRRGILARSMLRRRNARKMERENVLKTFYQLREDTSLQTPAFSKEAIQEKSHFKDAILRKTLARLRRLGFVKIASHLQWQLTDKGLSESRRVVRLHRLWELYLSHKLGMADDHIHDSAEAIEHLLTPDMEKRLMEELNYPTRDPHHSEIPYDDHPPSQNIAR